MEIGFTYTFDDIREAYDAGGRRKSRRGAVGWALFLALSLVCYLLNRALIRHLPPGVAPPTNVLPAMDPLLLLVPHVSSALLWFGLITIGIVTTRLKRRRGATVKQARKCDKVVGWVFTVLILAVVILNLYALSPARNAIDWHPGPAQQLFAAYSPWIAFCVLTAVLIFAFRSTTAQKAWARHLSLRRPKQLELDEQKFILRDDASERHIRWAPLARYRETLNLLIVHGEDGQIYIFPKRAFDAEQQMWLRSVIHTNIKVGEFLPRESAFPVLVPESALPVRKD
jgi:hypothetical protein